MTLAFSRDTELFWRYKVTVCQQGKQENLPWKKFLQITAFQIIRFYCFSFPRIVNALLYMLFASQQNSWPVCQWWLVIILIPQPQNLDWGFSPAEESQSTIFTWAPWVPQFGALSLPVLPQLWASVQGPPPYSVPAEGTCSCGFWAVYTAQLVQTDCTCKKVSR